MDTNALELPGALADPPRLDALHATELLDSMPEETFDRFTRLATRIIGVPVSLVSLVDLDRHFVKSQTGLDGPWADAHDIPMEHSFCSVVVRRNAPFVTQDIRHDPIGEALPGLRRTGVRAYAGVPLTTRDGYALGSLCAADTTPRSWSDEDVRALTDLAALVMSEIELRSELLRSEDRRADLERAALSIRTLHGALDAADADRLEAHGDALRVAADLAHELRTPLYAIRMLTEDLLDEAPGRLTPDLQRIGATTHEALDIIDHQLDLARTTAGRGVVRVGTLRVPELFVALQGMLEPLHRNQGVALLFDPVDDLPVLHTDGLKIAQILRNLATNALRHTRQGEVRLGAALTGEGRRVAFTVSDTGVGIAPADQERVFGRFEQVMGAAQAGGTGLGLPLARRMAQMVGGEIELHSTPGRGSRFTLVVPLQVRVAAPGVRIAPARG